MSNIVLITSNYLDKPFANGICAINIVNELLQMGHEVDVICYNNDNDKDSTTNNRIHTVDKTRITSRYVKLVFLKKVIRAVKFTLGLDVLSLDKRLVNNYIKKLYDLNRYKKIDLLIAMYFPLESIEALYEFKLRNRHIKGVVYELDSVADGVAQSHFQKQINRRYERRLLKIYELLDSIIVMKSHKNYWLKVFGKLFDSKLFIADIPVLNKKNSSVTSNNTPISMIYSGILANKYRSPLYLLSVLYELEKRLDFKFIFFSKGDCEYEIEKATQTIKGVAQKGFVAIEELEQEILKTDFLVSIGNSVSRSVPSKIITYISYGKPIIHFSSQIDDVCNEYFSKYPLALVIDQSSSIETSSTRILNFINKTRGKTIDFITIQKLFAMNTPKYSALLICELIKG